jgi:hypothetical protein
VDIVITPLSAESVEENRLGYITARSQSYIGRRQIKRINYNLYYSRINRNKNHGNLIKRSK